MERSAMKPNSHTTLRGNHEGLCPSQAACARSAALRPSTESPCSSSSLLKQGDEHRGAGSLLATRAA